MKKLPAKKKAGAAKRAKPAAKTSSKAKSNKPVARKPAVKKSASKRKAVTKKVTAKRKVAAKAAPTRKAVKSAARKPAVKRAVKAVVKTTATVNIVAAAKKPSYPPLIASVLAQLEDSKAEQIVTIDLVSKSTIADTMIIASGRSNRHVNAIADQVAQKLQQMGQKNLRIEGVPQCDWVLVDSGDVIVHIFRPEVRSFYNLEKLWSAPAAG